MYQFVLAAAAIVSPPPPIVSPPTYPVLASVRAAKTLVFDVTIRRGEMKLWAGRLMLASNGNATITQRSEQSIACASGSDRTINGRISTGFTLTLYGSYLSEIGPGVHVNARLDRANADVASAGLCADPSTRAVEIQTSFVPIAGKAVTLDGDAGFSVTLIVQ